MHLTHEVHDVNKDKKKMEHDALVKKMMQDKLKKKVEQEDLKKKMEQEALEKKVEQDDPKKKMEQEDLKKKLEQEALKKKVELEALKKKVELEALKKKMELEAEALKKKEKLEALKKKIELAALKKKMEAEALKKKLEKNLLQVYPEERDIPRDLLAIKPGQDREVQLSLFGNDYGEDAKRILSWLTYRSLLEEPWAKVPADPWMLCWEEVWDPATPSRDKKGEEAVFELAKLVVWPRLGMKQGTDMFVDPIFPPTLDSLFASPINIGRNEDGKQTDRTDKVIAYSPFHVLALRLETTVVETRRPISHTTLVAM